MIVGYARISAVEPKAALDAQKDELAAAGAEKIFAESAGSEGLRVEWDAASAFVREGDVLIVTAPGRLARSVLHLGEIVADLDRRGVSLRVLSLGADTATPEGRRMVDFLAALVRFEREAMLERRREGIAKARQEGRARGRSPTARAKSDDVLRLAADGMKRAAIAKLLGIGVASVYRILKDRRAQQ